MQNIIKNIEDLNRIAKQCEKMLIEKKSKYIFEIIKNSKRLQKLNESQINWITNANNFICDIQKTKGHDSNDKYFKVKINNITIESLPTGSEQLDLKINNKIFIQEHHWYNEIEDCLGQNGKNKLIKHCKIDNFTPNEFYEIICIIYIEILNFDENIFEKIK